MALDKVEDAIAAIAAGEMVIVVDDEDRENEGDLIMAASKAQAEHVGFMIRHTSGILCVPLLPETAERMGLPPMVASNDAPLQTAFTVSVDYKHGTTTGISAEERASTARALANPNSGAKDFVRPGHMFPLIAKEGGTLVRAGHTEAATDLCELAGLPPIGLIGELMNDDGSVQRMADLEVFARAHKLKVISIADLIRYRLRRERLIEAVREYDVTTEIGTARAFAYDTVNDSSRHLALVFGMLDTSKPVPVRIHRANAMEDLFAPDEDERGGLVRRALTLLQSKGSGVFVYLRIVDEPGLIESEAEANQKAPLSDMGSDRNAWREIGIGAQILKDLGIREIELLTPSKLLYKGLEGFDIKVVGTESI